MLWCSWRKKESEKIAIACLYLFIPRKVFQAILCLILERLQYLYKQTKEFYKTRMPHEYK